MKRPSNITLIILALIGVFVGSEYLTAKNEDKNNIQRSNFWKTMSGFALSGLILLWGVFVFFVASLYFIFFT
jgi:asparagine N-glycosylation enzyme membrane subunit Stt3